MADPCMFDRLPDSLILNICSYLSFSELQALALVNRRFKSIRHDRFLVRHTDLEGSYWLTEQNLRCYINLCSNHIAVLNLNNCYWLPKRILISSIRQCHNLQELQVIHCTIDIETIVQLVAEKTQLRNLSFSVSSFESLLSDVFKPAAATMKKLIRLKIYYTKRELEAMKYYGELPTLLDHCESLEELRIGSEVIAIPELYRPVVRCPERLLSLRHVGIASNIHAGAQMLFYGVLSQLHHDHINWETLLMPNVNLVEFSRKEELVHCFDSIEHLRALDVSGSKEPFDKDPRVFRPEADEKKDEEKGAGCLDFFSKATKLRYLNVACTLINGHHLAAIALAASRTLTSLNLYECGFKLYHSHTDIRYMDHGMTEIFEKCDQLRHLNIAGEHLHIYGCSSRSQNKILLSRMKGLTELSLPWCAFSDQPSEPRSDHPRRGVGRTMRAEPRFLPQVSQHGGSSMSPPSSSVSTVMNNITDNNPRLETLEILPVGFVSAIHKNKFISEKRPTPNNYCQPSYYVSDMSLLPICRFKHLRRLTIAGVSAGSGLSGKCLVAIAQCCVHLERLSLANLGDALMVGSTSFTQALVHLNNLRDLRLEQSTMALGSPFFNALLNASHLERLCIISRHTSLSPSIVVKVVHEMTELVVIQLFIDLTLCASRALTSTLNKRFQKLRPAFSVMIHPFNDEGIKSIPNEIPPKHFSELTRFSSNVCVEPP